MTTIRTGTCPKCNTRTNRVHCPKNPQCDWFTCATCKIAFDRRGWTNQPGTEEKK